MLIKFTSPTCQPCKELNRQLKEGTGTGTGIGVLLEEVDVTRNPDIAMQYGVRSVPTLVNLDTGEKIVGLEPILDYLRKQAA